MSTTRLFTEDEVQAIVTHLQLGAPTVLAAITVLDSDPKAWPPGCGQEQFTFPADVPVLVVRASDHWAIDAARAYHDETAAVAFAQWQREHSGDVKLHVQAPKPLTALLVEAAQAERDPTDDGAEARATLFEAMAGELHARELEA